MIGGCPVTDSFEDDNSGREGVACTGHVAQGQAGRQAHETRRDDERPEAGDGRRGAEGIPKACASVALASWMHRGEQKGHGRCTGDSDVRNLA